MALIRELGKALLGKFDGPSFLKVLEAMKSAMKVEVEKRRQK